MTAFLERGAVVNAAWHNYYPSTDHYCVSVKCATLKELEAIPPADVIPATVEAAVKFLTENGWMEKHDEKTVRQFEAEAKDWMDHRARNPEEYMRF